VSRYFIDTDQMHGLSPGFTADANELSDIRLDLIGIWSRAPAVPVSMAGPRNTSAGAERAIADLHERVRLTGIALDREADEALARQQGRSISIAQSAKTKAIEDMAFGGKWGSFLRWGESHIAAITPPWVKGLFSVGPKPVVTPQAPQRVPGLATSAAVAPIVAPQPPSALSPSGGLAAYEAQAGIHPSGAEWATGEPANGRADQWNNAAYNCTSWAAFRRSELKLPIPHGNGIDMAASLNPSGPVPGAVASLPATPKNAYGHVVIVEEVSSDGNRIRVSEMNMLNKVGYQEQWFERAPGSNIWHDAVSGQTTTLTFGN
jgi:surface antigen